MRHLLKVPNELQIACEYPITLHEMVYEWTDFDFLIGLTAIRDQKYRDFFKGNRPENRYRVVDSGVYEDPKNPPTCEKLLNIAMQLEADEVVPTDLINDCSSTLRNMSYFLGLAEQFPFKIQGVVQGRSLKEWLYCFQEFHDNPRVDVIGITYFEVPEDIKQMGMTDFGVKDPAEAARLTLLNLIAGGLGVNLYDHQDPGVPSQLYYEMRGPLKKPIHLLGLRDCRAIPYYRLMPFVRSIDTSFPVQLSIEGRSLHWDSLKPQLRVQFDATEFVRAEKALVVQNVTRFSDMCRKPYMDAYWHLADRKAEMHTGV